MVVYSLFSIPKHGRLLCMMGAVQFLVIGGGVDGGSYNSNHKVAWGAACLPSTFHSSIHLSQPFVLPVAIPTPTSSIYLLLIFCRNKTWSEDRVWFCLYWSPCAQTAHVPGCSISNTSDERFTRPRSDLILTFHPHPSGGQVHLGSMHFTRMNKVKRCIHLEVFSQREESHNNIWSDP